jgi:uncharacterized protein YigA (DUF484 family)
LEVQSRRDDLNFRPVQIRLLTKRDELGFLMIQAHKSLNRRSLHYATPDFLLNFMTLANFMRLSLRKGAHAALSSAAWVESRSGAVQGRWAVVRFRSPLIKPDVRISRIRLSD